MSLPPDSNFLGVILAGGKSKRMGRDKAKILLSGKPILLHVIDNLLTVFPKVVLVQDRPGHYDQFLKTDYNQVEILCDLIPDKGPLYGIQTACKKLAPAHLFVTACDMPFIKTELLHFLCREFNEGLLALVPRVDKTLQPLCAIYHSQKVNQYFEKNDPDYFDSPQMFFQKNLSCLKVIEEADLLAFDSEKASFRNLNSPEDLR